MSKKSKLEELENQIGELRAKVRMLVANFEYLWTQPEIQKIQKRTFNKRKSVVAKCFCYVSSDDEDQGTCKIDLPHDPCYYMWHGHCPYGEIPDEVILQAFCTPELTGKKK